MRSWLFTILSGVSLLLCVATCVIWIRSFWVDDLVILAHRRNSSSKLMESLTGNVAIEHDANYIPENGGGWWSYPARPSNGWTSVYGVDRPQLRMPTYFNDMAIKASVFVCPDWIIALSAAILPAISAAMWKIRRSRTIAGACPNCGYDLRFTPDRCPECGTVARLKIC